MAFLLSNGRRRKKRSKGRKMVARKARRRRRAAAPKVVRKHRRRRARAAAPVTRKVKVRRRRRRRSAPRVARRRGKKHTHWRAVKSHRRRTNPKVRRHRRHRRNPGFIGAVLDPIKEYGIGFAIGAAVNQYAVTPLLASFVPASVVSPAKVIVGPLLAATVKRFLPKFGKWADAAGLLIMAVGINETVQQFTGQASAVHGIGSVGLTRGLGSVGSTRGLASVGKTSGVGSLAGYGSGVPARMSAYDKSAGYSY
jgi:hypothetical protein